MNRSKVFEKQTRMMALAKLKASPKLWRIYQKQRPAWWYYLLLTFVVCIVPPGAGMTFIGLPFAGGLELINNGKLQAGLGCLAAGIALAAALAHASWLIQELLCSKSLAIVSQLPIGDEQFVFLRSRRLIMALILFGVVVMSFFAGIIAHVARPPWTLLGLKLVGLAGVEWIIVSSLTFIVLGYFPRVATPGVIAKFVGWGGLTFALAIMGRNVINLEKALDVLLLIVPTGWPLLMLKYGLLEPEPRIWLLLLGVAAMVGLAWMAFTHLRSKYHIAEISFSEGPLATAVLAKQFQDESSFDAELAVQDSSLSDEPVENKASSEIPLIRRIVDWLTFAKKEGQVVEISAEAAREKIRSRDFLLPRDWSRAGWIERTSARIFSDRESFLVELLTGGEPRWSYRLAVICIETLAGLFILYALSRVFGRGILSMSGHLALAAIIGIFRGAWPAALWRNKAGSVCSIAGALPIRVTEFNRLSMVLGVARVTMLLPMVLGLSILAIYGVRGKWDLVVGSSYGLKAALILISLHQWWPLAVLPASSTRTWWRILGDVGGAVILVMVWLASLVGLFIAGQSELWSLVAASGLLGTGWLFHSWIQRQFQKQPFDFVTTLRSDQQVRTQQVQAMPTRTW